MSNGYIENMWAIHNDDIGLYTGTFFTRKEAIESHVEALDGVQRINRSYRTKVLAAWAKRRIKGDRVVKIEINYVA